MKSTAKERFTSFWTIASIAMRNLSRHLTATILLGGVIGFGVLIISMMQGFTGAIMGNVSANLANLSAGHLYVTGSEKLPSGKEFSIIRDEAPLMAALQASGLKPKYVSRRAEFQATLIFESASTIQAVSGVDFSQENYLTERLSLVDGSFAGLNDEKAIIISQKMADKLKVKAGYRILVQLKTYSGQQNMGDFTVAAIVRDAGILSLASMSAYANITYVNKLLNMPAGSYQALSFYLPSMKILDRDGDKYYAALKARAQVFERKKEASGLTDVMSRLRGDKAETWTGTRFRVQTLNDRLSGLQTLVLWVNIASLIALGILFGVIMVGITNTFRMIMLDRIREIGTMRALGMQSGQVMALFLYEALFLSMGGALAGLILGFIAMGGISLYNLGENSVMSFFLNNGHMTFSPNPLFVIANIVIIGGLTLLAALIPARMAARLQPANALRTAK